MKRIIGIILLVAGLGVIGWSVYSSYQIFEAKKPAPQIFEMPAALELQQRKTPATQEQAMQQQAQAMIQEQLSQMIPRDTVTKLLNLIAWSIFAGILIFAGSKVAGIGVSLLR